MNTTHFSPTRTIDIASLFSGSDPVTDRAISNALAEHGSFIATGFAGAQRVAELLTFFAMHDADKLVCATCKYVPQHSNIYRGFYPLPK